jgi:hypothetical protein
MIGGNPHRGNALTRRPAVEQGETGTRTDVEINASTSDGGAIVSGSLRFVRFGLGCRRRGHRRVLSAAYRPEG